MVILLTPASMEDYETFKIVPPGYWGVADVRRAGMGGEQRSVPAKALPGFRIRRWG